MCCIAKMVFESHVIMLCYDVQVLLVKVKNQFINKIHFELLHYNGLHFVVTLELSKNIVMILRKKINL